MEHAFIIVLGLTGLLAITSLLLPVAQRINFPYTVLLAAVGIVFGIVVNLFYGVEGLWIFGDFVTAMHDFNITSEAVFFIFLPALVFESALAIDVRKLFDDLAPILMLAVVGLLISTFTIAGVIYPFTVGIPFVVCVLLGAIVSATDPVAVVAIDPSSPFTGGAILGDRVRMQRHTDDDGVYIRSMANRGHLGGIAAATPRVVALLDGLGYSEILIETVGVGQAEVEVASSADTVVVVVNPGWGDAVQAAKAGLLEVGDVFVVNKADRPGAKQAVKELIGALEIGQARPWLPPVVETVATDGAGLAELWDAIAAHRSHLDESGEREQRRLVRVLAEVEAALRASLRQMATSSGALAPEILDRVLARQVDPWSVASEMVAGGSFETS